MDAIGATGAVAQDPACTGHCPLTVLGCEQCGELAADLSVCSVTTALPPVAGTLC